MEDGGPYMALLGIPLPLGTSSLMGDIMSVEGCGLQQDTEEVSPAMQIHRTYIHILCTLLVY